MWIARLLLVLPILYVLPTARVLEQVELARKKQPAVHVSVQLSGTDQSWPQHVEADLHPSFGIRISDGAGGRWVVRSGRVAASNRPDLPVWIPQLEPLILPNKAQLESWFGAVGIDAERNDLGRCGSEDCFVLGGRDGAAQLWLEKDRFEPRRFAVPNGRNYRYEDYRDFEKLRFPGKITVSDGDEVLATWTVQSAYQVASLGPQDFSERWVRR